MGCAGSDRVSGLARPRAHEGAARAASARHERDGPRAAIFPVRARGHEVEPVNGCDFRRHARQDPNQTGTPDQWDDLGTEIDSAQRSRRRGRRRDRSALDSHAPARTGTIAARRWRRRARGRARFGDDLSWSVSCSSRTRLRVRAHELAAELAPLPDRRARLSSPATPQRERARPTLTETRAVFASRIAYRR